MIRKIRARNFLSFQDLDLELRTTNVIVGPNMSGKTNLLSLLKFLTLALGPAGIARTLLDFGGMSELAWKGSEKPELQLALSVEVPDVGSETSRTYEYELSIKGSFQTPQVIVERESLALVRNGARQQLFELSSGRGQWMSDSGPSALQLDQVDRSFLEIVSLPTFEGTTFKRYVNSWRFYRLLPTPFMRQQNAPSSEVFLKEVGDNFSSWFLTLQAYPEHYARIKQAASDILPSLSDILIQPTQMGAVSLGSRERDLRRNISIRHMSDGELVFLALLSLILAPPELGAPVYCVEEPENYLHPRMIQALMEMLEQRQQESGPQAAQILATTHSPHLVDKVGIDDLLVANKAQGKTAFERPASDQELRAMLSRREAGLGDLWFSGALGGV